MDSKMDSKLLQVRVVQVMAAWLAVTTLILATGCSKGGGGAPPPPPVADPVASQVNDLTPAELDVDSSVPSHEQVGRVSGVEDDLEASIVVYDPKGMTPEEIFSASANIPATTGLRSDVRDSSGQELVYSGSGQDSLREELQSVVRGVQDPAQRRANQEFASQVSFASMFVDPKTGDARVSVVIRPMDGVRRQHDFTGRLDGNRILSVGSGTPISVVAACMDLDGGCQTAHLVVRDRSQNSGVRTAHVIVRETSASVYVRGNGFYVSKNPEYDQFLQVIVNTARKEGMDRVTHLTLSTTEVIDGASSFVVSMWMDVAHPQIPRVSTQSVVWAGPLVKPFGSDVLNVPVRQVPSMEYSQNDEVTKVVGVINDTIRETRLVRNDGHGNLQLNVTIRKGPKAGAEDTMQLTIGRVHKPVRSAFLQ